MATSNSFNSTAIGKSAQDRLDLLASAPVRALPPPAPVTLEMLLGPDYDAGKVREQIAAHLARFQHHSTSDVANVAYFLYRRLTHEAGAQLPFISFAFAYNTDARQLAKPELPYATVLRCMASIAHTLKSRPFILEPNSPLTIKHQKMEIAA
jgi:hypothetical protein